MTKRTLKIVASATTIVVVIAALASCGSNTTHHHAASSAPAATSAAPSSTASDPSTSSTTSTPSGLPTWRKAGVKSAHKGVAALDSISAAAHQAQSCGDDYCVAMKFQPTLHVVKAWVSSVESYMVLATTHCTSENIEYSAAAEQLWIADEMLVEAALTQGNVAGAARKLNHAIERDDNAVTALSSCVGG